MPLWCGNRCDFFLKTVVVVVFGLSLIQPSEPFGQETKHVKIGHVKIDRAHFRVHFREHWKISREHWKISREHSRGSLRGDPLVCFTQKKPQPSWAFPWTSSCTLPCAFPWALSWEGSWVKFRGSRALCLSDRCQICEGQKVPQNPLIQPSEPLPDTKRGTGTAGFWNCFSGSEAQRTLPY